MYWYTRITLYRCPDVLEYRCTGVPVYNKHEAALAHLQLPPCSVAYGGIRTEKGVAGSERHQ